MVTTKCSTCEQSELKYVGCTEYGFGNYWCPCCGSLFVFPAKNLILSNLEHFDIKPDSRYKDATFFVCSDGDAPYKIHLTLYDAFEDGAKFIDLFDIQGNPVKISFELVDEETLEYACSIG